MVTLSLLQQMQDDGLGTIDTNLFFQEIALDSQGKARDGVWLVSRGAPVSRLNINVQQFDLYVRYPNKVTAFTKAEALLEYLKDAYINICDLPACPPYTTQTYKDVRIVPLSGIETVGQDENEKLVLVISGQIQFNKGE